MLILNAVTWEKRANANACPKRERERESRKVYGVKQRKIVRAGNTSRIFSRTFFFCLFLFIVCFTWKTKRKRRRCSLIVFDPHVMPSEEPRDNHQNKVGVNSVVFSPFLESSFHNACVASHQEFVRPRTRAYTGVHPPVLHGHTDSMRVGAPARVVRLFHSSKPYEDQRLLTLAIFLLWIPGAKGKK